MILDLIAYGLMLFGLVLIVLGIVYRPDPNEEAYEDAEPWQLDPPIILTERNYRQDAQKPEIEGHP